MTGVDTNILVRYLAEDDEEQARRVHRFLSASRISRDIVFISCIALCELAWVLRDGYHWTKPRILNQIESLLEIEAFEVEEETAVRRAIELARTGKGDFPDYLIGQLNLARGCRFTVTFDRALKPDPAFSVL